MVLLTLTVQPGTNDVLKWGGFWKVPFKSSGRELSSAFSPPWLDAWSIKFWGEQSVYTRQPPNARFLMLPCYVALPSTLSVPNRIPVYYL